MSAIADSVDKGDLDRLIGLVDSLCSSRDWDGVVELRDRCRQALERGLQLWPAAGFAEYRLALEAPGPYAGAVVVAEAGRFALGPLWEVAAGRHAWEELAEHIPAGPARTLCAHERVIRGEDLSGDPTVDPHLLEIPLMLQGWEPPYPTAEYQADKAEFPAPDLPRPARVELPDPGIPVDDPAGVEALLDLVSPWVEQSNGSAAAVAVEGSARSAIAALGYGEALLAEMPTETALALMTWAGASGGAYGRRRGTPVGRFSAWWAGAALAGVEWPPRPEKFIDDLARLEWTRWEPPGAASGWSASIAVQDRETGRAWALLAVDSHREEDALAP